jgi:hypothetical protein
LIERIYFIEYKGKKILVENFSGMIPGKEFMDLLDEAAKVIRSQPAKSVLAVFDASNAHFNNEILDAMKNFTKENTPYIKGAAVVGITGLLKVALTAVSKFSGREFNPFNSREEAMEWLVNH